MSGHCGGETHPAYKHPRWTFASLGRGAQKGPLLCRHTWPGLARSTAPVFTGSLPAPDPEDAGTTGQGEGPGGGTKNGEEKHTVLGGCSPEAVPAPPGPRPWPHSQGLQPSLSEGPPAEVRPSGGTKPRDKRPWKRRPGDRRACEDGASSQGTQGACGWKDPSGEPPGKHGPARCGPGLGSPACHSPGLGGPACHGPGLGVPACHGPGLGDLGPERTQHCGLRPLWGRVLAAQDSHPPRHTSGVPPRSWPGARGISVGQEGAAQSWGQGLGGPPLNFFCVFLAPLTPEGAKCRPGIHETDAECESGEQAMVWPARRGPWVCGVCSRRPRGSPGSALSRVSRARFSDNMGWLGAWRGGSKRDPPPRSWGVIKLIIRSVGLGVNKQMKNRGRSW